MSHKYTNITPIFVNREHIDEREVLMAIDALSAHLREAPLPDAEDHFAATVTLDALAEILRAEWPGSRGPSPLSVLVGQSLTVLKRQTRAAA